MKSIKYIYKIGKGPSSSHSIGPERAALIFREKFPFETVDKYVVHLFDSLSKTGVGHGTDRVLIETLGKEKTEIIFEKDVPENLPHPNTMDFEALKDGKIIGTMRALSVGGGDIKIVGESEEKSEKSEEDENLYLEKTFAEVLDFCRFRNLTLDEYVEFNEGKGIWDYLKTIWDTMQSSIKAGLSKEGILGGGLNIQRKAKLLYEKTIENEIAPIMQSRIISSYALAVSEENADNGTIVTAPTCGSCGVLPSVLYYAKTHCNISDEKIIRALGVAGLFGNIIKQNASISGAECGCQAEIGSATSMAAAAMAFIFDHDTNQIQHAAEIAMEHQLGLTCDPICGLVQVPCIERNAVAANRAIDACNLSNFLDGTERISFDIVVKTMYETGISMNQRFRETAEGGLAKIYRKRRE